LLRLRHDIVMIRRACVEPLPAQFSEVIRPSLERVGQAVTGYFHGCSRALISRHMPPPLEPLQAELGAYASTFAEMRQRARLHLSVSQLERLIALGFALEQLQRNMIDLSRCVREWAASPRRVAGCQRGADGDEEFLNSAIDCRPIEVTTDDFSALLPANPIHAGGLRFPGQSLKREPERCIPAPRCRN